MSYTIIDGHKIAEDLKQDLRREAGQLAADGIRCGLATITVGDDYSARAYRRRLAGLAAELNVTHRQFALPEEASEQDLVSLMGMLNMVGDVAFSEVAPRTRAISPVPGGSAR